MFVQKLFICSTNRNNVKLTTGKKISRTSCLISKGIWLPEQIFPLQITIPPNISAIFQPLPVKFHSMLQACAGVCMSVCSHLLKCPSLDAQLPLSPCRILSRAENPRDSWLHCNSRMLQGAKTCPESQSSVPLSAQQFLPGDLVKKLSFMVKRKMMSEFPAIMEFTGRIFFISLKTEDLFLSRALSTLPQVLILPGSRQLEIFSFKACSLWILWQRVEHKGHLQRMI